MSDSNTINSLPSILKVRPLLLLTGFLGAGKTTLLRELLENLNAREIKSDVILNDRENAYLDKATLNDLASEIKPLTGSCVCCDGYHDLINMINKVSKSPNDVLLVEFNGASDPTPLQETFTSWESKFCLRPRWQVCVIDPRHFQKRRRFNELEALQLELASHYYISWSSELSNTELEELEALIRSINPRASRTTSAQLAEVLDAALKNNKNYNLRLQTPSHTNTNPLILEIPSKNHDTEHKNHQLAHEFTGCHIIIPEPVEKNKIQPWLEQLPDSVIRAKTLLSIADDDKLYVYERVGMTVSPDPISARTRSETPCCGIFIGAELDPEEILKITKEYLHPNCHLS